MPVALDLFCCQGGMSQGLHEAGFDVFGIDFEEQPLYPFPFMRTDALAALDALIDGKRLNFNGVLLGAADIDFVHTSPPCPRYTQGNAANDVSHHPALIEPTRERLDVLGIPYTIENVIRAPLTGPVLCGTMFGLTAIDTDGTELFMRRHRRFENNWGLVAPAHETHSRNVQWAGAYSGARRDKDEARYIRKGGYVPPALDVLRALVGAPWMDEYGTFQCIPPAYGQYIGEQFLYLTREK